MVAGENMPQLITFDTIRLTYLWICDAISNTFNTARCIMSTVVFGLRSFEKLPDRVKVLML